MPLDFKPLQGKDPEAQHAERLLKAGYSHEPSRHELRKLERQEKAGQVEALPSHQPIGLKVELSATRDFRRFNRDRGQEVERLQQRERQRGEAEIDSAHQRRLEELNAPLQAKTEKNRRKRHKRQLRQQAVSKNESDGEELMGPINPSHL